MSEQESPSTPTLERFSDLPKEIRLQIFKESITPGILTLKPKLALFDPETLPKPFCYRIGKYLAHLEPEYNTPALLQVCKESRDIAFENGYEAFVMREQAGKRVRNVMWNPKLDTIMLGRKKALEYPLDLLIIQYPKLAQQAIRIAVWSSMWQPGSTKNSMLVWPLLKMPQVKEFVVMVDGEFEQAEIQRCRQNAAYSPWDISSSITSSIKRIFRDVERTQSTRLKSGLETSAAEHTSVRVVWDEEGLLGNEDLSSLTLRTDLFFGSNRAAESLQKSSSRLLYLYSNDSPLVRKQT